MTWLFDMLKSNVTAVDRMGAAQGLAEVIHGQGDQHLASIMPEIIRQSSDIRLPPHVRDGYSMLFIYLPKVFGEGFVPYVSKVIGPILNSLADQCEFVRDTALKAGQVIVKQFCDISIETLLPELEGGLSNADWRIRHASIVLLGDMMFHISGVSGKGSTETQEEEGNFGTEEGMKIIAARIGSSHRDNILAGLYLGRHDVAHPVRTASVHVWKVIVSNTARTLKTILPNLIMVIIKALSSEAEDARNIAGRTLGELVKKLGDRLLPEIIPLLERNLVTGDEQVRRGVCIGLSEIVINSNHETVEEYAGKLVPALQAALSDSDSEVRHQAGSVFDGLLDKIGDRALDEIIPPILKDITEHEGTDKGRRALDSLKAIVLAEADTVAKYVIPRLTEPPVNTNIIAFLSGIVPEVFHEHLKKIIRAICNTLVKKRVAGEMEEYAEILEDARKVVDAVEEDVGIKIMLDELLELTRDPEKPDHRCASMQMLASLAKNEYAEISQFQHQTILRTAFKFFYLEDQDTTDACWETVKGLMGRIIPKNIAGGNESDIEEADDLKNNIGAIRDAVRTLNMEMKKAGVTPSVGAVGLKSRKKAFDPFWPLLKEGLTRTQADVRESTANAILDLVKLLDPASFKPSLISVVGGLIRALGDKWASKVKSATINCASEIVAKSGVMCKAFVPQLQTVFCKSLLDVELKTRKHAAAAISNLSKIQPKSDQLVNEILKVINKEDSQAFLETSVYAIRQVLINGGGKKLKVETCDTLIETLQNLDGGTQVKHVCAACLGVLGATTAHDGIKDALSKEAGMVGLSDELQRSCNMSMLSSILKTDGNREDVLNEMMFLVKSMSTGLDQMVFATRTVGYLINHAMLGEITCDYEGYFDLIYNRVDSSPEPKRDIWNGITWSLYSNFPVASEVDVTKINLKAMQFICEQAASKSGGKIEKSNMVTKAADEVILACVSQFSLKFVLKSCQEIEIVDQVIWSRLKKSNAVTSSALSTVPVLYSNIDTTAYAV